MGGASCTFSAPQDGASCTTSVPKWCTVHHDLASKWCMVHHTPYGAHTHHPSTLRDPGHEFAQADPWSVDHANLIVKSTIFGVWLAEAKRPTLKVRGPTSPVLGPQSSVLSLRSSVIGPRSQVPGSTQTPGWRRPVCNLRNDRILVAGPIVPAVGKRSGAAHMLAPWSYFSFCMADNFVERGDRFGVATLVQLGRPSPPPASHQKIGIQVWI
jgi:hypothetical protein